MRTFLLSVASVLLMGCSTNIDMTLPVGPEGPAGKDAYALWVEAVENGIIEWEEATDLSGFFRYLKGDPGTDGQDAYDLWIEMVAEGIEDPHNPPDEWDPNETCKDDFFRFLTGKDGAPGGLGNPGTPGSILTIGNNGNWFIDGVDTEIPATGEPGLSAWKLWIEDVQDEDGLEDPHNEGELWDTEEVDLDDFWQYLRGEDGEDGISPTIPIVDPGQSGSDVTPISGKHNVIAQYTQKAYSEYVSTTDGSVTYQVYLDNGLLAPNGTIVSEMPGIPGKTYTLNSGDGTFTVPRGDLPTSGSVEERYGSAKVDGVKSAPNTYVPQKIDVRLMIGYGTHTMPTLMGRNNTDSPSGGVYMSVPVRAQRKVTSEGEWEDLPGYLPDVARTVHAYEIDLESDDPAAPNMDKRWKFHSSDARIALTGATVGVRRPTMRVQWMPEQTQIDDYFLLEDDMTTAFTMVLDDATGLYGDKPATRDVIMYAPVNFHPLPKNLVMNGFTSGVGTSGALTWRSGSFDVNTDMFDPDCTIITDFLFATNYYEAINAPAVGDVKAYRIWNPDDTTRPNNDCLGIGFRVPGDITGVGTINMSSIGDPDYTVNDQAVYIGSDVFLRTTSLLVAGPGLDVKIGTLVEKPALSGQYVIEPVDPFTFADIPIYADANLIPTP